MSYFVPRKFITDVHKAFFPRSAMKTTTPPSRFSCGGGRARGLRQTSHSAGHWRFLPPFFFCGCWCNFFSPPPYSSQLNAPSSCSNQQNKDILTSLSSHFASGHGRVHALVTRSAFLPRRGDRGEATSAFRTHRKAPGDGSEREVGPSIFRYNKGVLCTAQLYFLAVHNTPLYNHRA